ncbi:MAG: HlyD family secretion protein [Chthoniobacterales bacterium]
MAKELELEDSPPPALDERRSISAPRRIRARLGRRALFTILALLGLGVLTVAGLYWFAQIQSYQSSDDAFIDGHIINIAPKIAGRVDQVFVDDNQEVGKRDRLIEIDPRDFNAALRQKQAALQSSGAQAAAVEATVQQAQAHVKTLQATVDSDRATADADRAQNDKAQSDERRYEDLFKNKVVSPSDVDQYRATAKAAQATLEAALKKVTSDQAQVAEALAQVNTYLALYQSVQAQIGEAEANVQSAHLNQSYTEIQAPEDGRVTRKAVEPGDYVQTGQTILALVPKNVWVTANFKENQIGKMRPGQPVEIEVDALHGLKFRGHIDSIQSGSGARFSLLPPENATGNYVKVVQRVPVKILFDTAPDVGLPLGPGESAVPTVKVEDFHYSLAQLLVVAAIFVAASILILKTGLGRRSEKVRSSGSR